MADNLSDWKTVIGEAFNIKRPESGDDDKTYFTVKTLTKGTYVNCTLWDNSHGDWLEANGLEKGDIVIVNGKVKKKPKENGEGLWVNMSIARIGKVSMDSGVDTREGGSGGSGDDEGKADDDDVM